MKQGRPSPEQVLGLCFVAFCQIPCFAFLLLFTTVIGVRSTRVVCILGILISSVPFRGSRDCNYVGAIWYFVRRQCGVIIT